MASGAGEGPLQPSMLAIAEAIYAAMRVRNHALPFSPPCVWRALQEKAAHDAARELEREAAD